MTSKEMEALSGVARANIRYYEAEGLLTPQRLKNGYRTYSEEDLAVLEKIKLLRRLGVSIEALRALQQGGAALSAVLDRRLQELEAEQATLLRVSRICGELRAESPTFETLEPQKYLEALDAPAPQSEAQSNSPPLPAADTLPTVSNLWRRLAARVLDWLFLLLLVIAVTSLLGQNMMRFAELGLPASLCLEVLRLLLESLLLHLFATTPGKALLGLRITRPDGGKLSYGEGVVRHLRMLWGARGFWIPIWSWIQIYKCCKRWSEEEPQPWDEGLAYTAQPFQVKRHLGGAALACLAALMVGEAVNSFSQLPPHRGDLTVAEFAENYNRQAAYLNGNSKYYLDEEGHWQAEPDPPGTFTINLSGEWQTDHRFQYTLKDGALKAVTLECAVENTDKWMGIPSSTVITAVTAFVWAQKETPFWTSGRKPLIKALDGADWGQDFVLRQDGAEITWEVEKRNFQIHNDNGLAIPGNQGDNFLAFRCRVALVE